MIMATTDNGHFVHDPEREVSRRVLAFGKARHPNHTDKEMARAAGMTVGAMQKARQRDILSLRHCLYLIATWFPDALDALLEPLEETLAECDRIIERTKYSQEARQQRKPD